MDGMMTTTAARVGLASLWQFFAMLAAYYAGPWWRLFGSLDNRETAAMFGGIAPRDNSKGTVHAHLAERYLAAVSPVWLAGVPVGDVAELMSWLGAMERYELTCDNPRVVDVLPGHGAETHVGHLDLWPQIETDSRANFIGYGGVLVQTAYLCEAWEWLRCPKGRVRVAVLSLVKDKPENADRALRLVWPDGAVIVVATYDGDVGDSDIVRELHATPVEPPQPAADVPAAPEGDYDPVADRARMLGIVASTLDAYGLSKCTVLTVRRGILDDEAFRALSNDCLDIDSTDARELVLEWLTDLSKGRHDRIDRSETAWCRAQCVGCAKEAFYFGGRHCGKHDDVASPAQVSP